VVTLTAVDITLDKETIQPELTYCCIPIENSAGKHPKPLISQHCLYFFYIRGYRQKIAQESKQPTSHFSQQFFDKGLA
jgi:hypothetical protein